MSRYRVCEGKVSSRVLDDEAILLSHETNHCYALNRTGSIAWELLARPQGASLDELIQLWSAPQPDNLRALLERLSSEGLIELAQGEAASPQSPPLPDFEPFVLEKYGTLEQLILSGE